MTKFLRFCLAAMIFGATISRAENPFGFDSGHTPENALRLFDDLGLTGRHGTWIRLRHMSGSPVIDLHAKGADHIGEVINSRITVSSRRKALIQLRHRGFRFAAMLRWSKASWNDGVRAGKGQRLPVNLREPFERCRALAFTYGDLVDYWEIENEPDIGFVDENAETFAAFFKACSLGIRAGNRDRASLHPSNQNQLPEVPNQRTAKSLVMGSPMALPPGPYWEQLVANDYLAYVDAFNYHYYGYAEDFAAVRDCWRIALDEAGYPQMPVFLTEYGYGLLDYADSVSHAGRLVQRDWFREVALSISEGTIQGAMAFYLLPYYPRLTHEFGLLAKLPSNLDIPHNPTWTPPNPGPQPIENRESSSVSPNARQRSIASGLEQPTPRLASVPNQPSHSSFQTSSANEDAGGEQIPAVIDFLPGADMRQIKRYNSYMVTGGSVAKRTAEFTLKRTQLDRSSPTKGIWSVTFNAGTLALLPSLTKRENLDTESPAPKPLSTESITARSPRPTLRSSERPTSAPDWPNANTPILKARDKAYAITPALEFLSMQAFDYELVHGSATLEVQHRNSSAFYGLHVKKTNAASVTFRDTPPAGDTTSIQPTRVRSAQGLISGTILLSEGETEAHFRAKIPSTSQGGILKVGFHPADGSRPLVLTTRLIPSAKGRTIDLIDSFNFPAEAATNNRNALLNRPLATAEPASTVDGRWLVTNGLSVEETATGWRFTVTDLPPEPMRPAIAELPLPDEWSFPPDSSFTCYYRLDTSDPRRTEECESYFRTTSGNLYQVWPRWMADSKPKPVRESARNYSLAFYGRSQTPWRFSEQSPASLVFMLRPRTLPAVFEISGPRIIGPNSRVSSPPVEINP